MRTVLCVGVCALAVACGPDTTGRGPARYDLTAGGDAGADDTDLSVVLPDLAGAGSSTDMAGGSGTCTPPAMPKDCPGALDPKAGCVAQEDCGDGGTGNSLDDDCNGMVDDGCRCTPGDVEPCFAGPPGKRHIGACTDGTQTCGGSGEFVQWGACMGSIGPTAESCDKLDNDCNGCADDGLCCASVLDCPGPGDPRIPPVAPFSDVALKGELFYPSSATSWKWQVEGGPCDQLFKTTTNPPVQSFTLNNANGIDATVHFTLSGDYTITLTIVDTSGMTQTCKWVQHVVAPGVRFELCWDHTGPGPKGSDLDLHVHRPASTKDWFDSSDDCYYSNCVVTSTGTNNVNWGYAGSNLANCSGSPNGSKWKNSCGNPRLDIDNIDKVGVPENSNIDDPNDGDTFRAMVHYYGQRPATTPPTHVEQHPIVNIYCGGTLKATYGQAPNTLGPCGAGSTSCFDYGPNAQSGLMWRVADVTAHVAGGTTTDCTINAIHPPDMGSGYLVTTDKTTF